MKTATVEVMKGRREVTLPAEYALSERVYDAETFLEFLAARFDQLKKEFPRSYSHRVFSQIAGFASPNYLCMMINGQRLPSVRGLLKVARGLLLEPSDEALMVSLYLASFSKEAPNLSPFE